MESQTQKKILLFVVAVIIVWFVFAIYSILFSTPSWNTNSWQNFLSGLWIQTGTINSWTLISWNILSSTNQTENSTPAQKTLLTIALPSTIWNNRVQLQRIPLREKFNTILQTKRFETEAEYKNFLENGFEWTGKEIDIAIVPYERLDFFSGQIYKIEFTTTSPSIDSLFSSIFRESILASKGTFIPVGIDPLVTVHDKSTDLKSSEISFEQLLAFAQLFTIQKDKSILPVLFGADKNDIKLLESNQEWFPHYSQILYQFFKIAYQNNNTKLLSNLISLSSSANGPRNYTNYKRTILQLTKENSSCESYPQVCLFVFWKVKTVMSFLSDRENRSPTFPTALLSQSDLVIKNIPRNQASYPVRWRWFIINKNSKNLVQALNFINIYLKQGADQKVSSQNYLLSPFIATLSIQQFEPRFSFLKKYISSFDLITTSPSVLHSFFTTTKALEVLKWSYNISLFLTNLKRNF